MRLAPTGEAGTEGSELGKSWTLLHAVPRDFPGYVYLAVVLTIGMCT